MKSAGADSVSVVVPLCQKTYAATRIYACTGEHDYLYTPSDASLQSIVRYIRSQGMTVLLDVQLETYDYSWRAHINVADADLPAWFTSYGAALRHVGAVGQSAGATTLSVGTELNGMVQQVAYRAPTPTVPGRHSHHKDIGASWHALLVGLRKTWHGRLVYADDGNLPALAIPFWSDLDAISVTEYIPLVDAGATFDRTEALRRLSAWKHSNVDPALRAYPRLKLLVLETGYRSASDAGSAPYDATKGTPDPTIQAQCYDAALGFWSRQTLDGFYLWDWQSDPSTSGLEDTGYTPSRKPAEAVVRQYWRAVSP